MLAQPIRYSSCLTRFESGREKPENYSPFFYHNKPTGIALSRVHCVSYTPIGWHVRQQGLSVSSPSGFLLFWYLLISCWSPEVCAPGGNGGGGGLRPIRGPEDIVSCCRHGFAKMAAIVLLMAELKCKVSSRKKVPRAYVSNVPQVSFWQRYSSTTPSGFLLCSSNMWYCAASTTCTGSDSLSCGSSRVSQNTQLHILSPGTALCIASA